jgi:hypothetical protein
MLVQQFLAQQWASFVLVRYLLGQMVSAFGCTEREAAQTLSTCLVQAGHAAPAWYVYREATGPEEQKELGKDSGLLMLDQLMSEDPIYDPKVSKDETYDRWIAVSRSEVITHYGVWYAYQEAGFLAHEIYSLLSDNGVNLPGADTVLGSRAPNDGLFRGDSSAPLTPADKNEIRKLRADGVSARDLSERFKKSLRTIYDVLKQGEPLLSPRGRVVRRL